MEFVLLIVAVSATALLVHLTRHRALFAIIVILGGTGLSWYLLSALPPGPYEFAGLTLTLDPLLRLFILFAFAVNGLLALSALLDPAARESVSFLYWCWLPWLFALSVDNFALAVLAWGFGLYALSLAHAPGRAGQVGGAAHYLLIVILSVSGLLIANRFFELYPLTPDQTNLIQVGVLFLAWALGLALAVVPFHFWLSALAGETGLVFFTALTGWGLTFGLWFLFELLRRFLWLTEKSNLLALLVMGGVVTTVVSGLSAAIERRAGRWLAFAGLFALGPLLIDLGRARYDLLLNAGLGLVGRGLALALCVAALALFYATSQSWARAFSIGGLVFGGAALIGLPFTPAFISSLPLWSEYAASDMQTFSFLALAALGVWLGMMRVVYPMIMLWRMRAPSRTPVPQSEPAVERTETGEAVAESKEADPVVETKGIEVTARANPGPAAEKKVEPPKIIRVGERKDGYPVVPDESESKSESESYDPIQEVGETLRRFLAWLRVLIGHSPRLMHGFVYLVANWQTLIGVLVVLALALTILTLGTYPKLLLDPLATAIGSPAYLK